MKPNYIKAVRELDTWVSQAWDTLAENQRFDRVSVGGANFDLQLETVVTENFLRAINAGDEPAAAAVKAKEAGSQVVRDWNRNMPVATIGGKQEISRWTGSGDRFADQLQVRFEALR